VYRARFDWVEIQEQHLSRLIYLAEITKGALYGWVGAGAVVPLPAPVLLRKGIRRFGPAMVRTERLAELAQNCQRGEFAFL
jgi:hypothetical protein